MTGDYHLRRYSPIAYNILRDGEVVALSNMLMNKRWNLRDGNDRALTDRTFATPKEAFQFFLSEMAPVSMPYTTRHLPQVLAENKRPASLSRAQRRCHIRNALPSVPLSASISSDGFFPVTLGICPSP